MANRVFFTSDLHFCHDKHFIYNPRGFSSVEEMNESIVKNFNEVMDETDKLYILGDCFLNDNDKGLEYMRRLPGEKYIIYGNHDTVTRQQLMAETGFNCLGYAYLQKFGKYHLYLSHYPTETSNMDDGKPLNKRVICLSGHTHSKDKFYQNKFYIYNVALDAHNNYPVELSTVIENVADMKARSDWRGFDF